MEKIEGEPNKHTVKRRNSGGFERIKKALGLEMSEREKHRRSIILSIFNGLTQFLLGGVNTMVLAYSITSGNLHAVFCTFAWNFFTAEAILSFNYSSGWASTLVKKYRRLAHLILQVCSVISLMNGTVLTFYRYGISTTAHGMTGFVAFIMTLMTMILGPIALNYQQNLKILHICVAIPTFLLSCTCLCLGLFRWPFVMYVGGVAISYVLTGWVALSTTFIIVMVIVNLRLRIQEYE